MTKDPQVVTRDTGEDVLPVAVFSMKKPFTYNDLHVRLKCEFGIMSKKLGDLDVNELVAGVYLNRLVQYGILEQRGSTFWFA